jgi:hypothetical protein
MDAFLKTSRDSRQVLKHIHESSQILQFAVFQTLCMKLDFIDILYVALLRSQDSAVGIATGYGLHDRGVRILVPVGSRILFSMSSGLALGPSQPPIQWVPGALSPGVKWWGCEADNSPPASAKVKKMWIYTSTPPYAFMA